MEPCTSIPWWNRTATDALDCYSIRSWHFSSHPRATKCADKCHWRFVLRTNESFPRTIADLLTWIDRRLRLSQLRWFTPTWSRLACDIRRFVVTGLPHAVRTSSFQCNICISSLLGYVIKDCDIVQNLRNICFMIFYISQLNLEQGVRVRT